MEQPQDSGQVGKDRAWTVFFLQKGQIVAKHIESNVKIQPVLPLGGAPSPANEAVDIGS